MLRVQTQASNWLCPSSSSLMGDALHPRFTRQLPADPRIGQPVVAGHWSLSWGTCPRSRVPCPTFPQSTSDLEYIMTWGWGSWAEVAKGRGGRLCLLVVLCQWSMLVSLLRDLLQHPVVSASVRTVSVLSYNISPPRSGFSV